MKAVPYLFELDAEGIAGQTVLLDVDGTILASGDSEVSPEVRASVNKLRKNNEVFLFSNNVDSGRLVALARELNLPHVASRRRKPDPWLRKDIPARFPLVVIGDKILTDGLFAYFTGARFIEVKSLRGSNESLATRFLYRIDGVAEVVVKALEHLAAAYRAFARRK